MLYRLDISWNNTKVFSGRCSSVLAHENLKLMLDQFSGTGKSGVAAAFKRTAPTLKTLIDAKTGDHWSGEFGDGTGTCQFWLTKVGATPCN